MTEKKTQSAKKHDAKIKQSELEKLSGQFEQLQKEKDDVFAQLQRVSADYANFQKRSPKQIADSVAYEKEKIIKSILPVLDNFEHILQNADSAEDIKVLVKGIEIIYDQMLGILKSHNVEQIKAAGEKFDPAFHEAMMQRQDPKSKEGIVLEEFLKGYKLNERVIRPSKVIVNKKEVAAEPEAEAEEAPKE